MGGACASKPSGHGIEAPQPGDRATFVMSKGCCSQGWIVNNENDEPWLWVASDDGKLQLESLDDDEVFAVADVDDEHYETVVKSTVEWTDSDSSSDDDDDFFWDMEDDDPMQHKLKWKCKRKVDFSCADGSNRGSLALKLKGKAKTRVHMASQGPTPEKKVPEILQDEAEVKKAVFTLLCNGKESKFKNPDAHITGDIEFPDAFDFDWQSGCLKESMTLTVVGDEVPVPLVPLVGAIVAEHLQPQKIANQMQSQARNQAISLARSPNRHQYTDTFPDSWRT